MKYRKKPVEVEAFRFMIDEHIPEWFSKAMNEDIVIPRLNGTCEIKTLEGTMKSSFGDYIIQGVDGELYPCKPDIFEKTYDRVE